MVIALIIIIAYLIGSISFGVVFCKIFGKEDVRNFGSGNAGTTNILRTYGKKAAALVLLGDALKGTAGAVIGNLLLQGGIAGMYIGGIAALVGHMFPIYFKFKGGKGIATTAGVLIYINPLLLSGLLTVFIVSLCITRYVSFSSIMAAIAYPICTYAYNVMMQNNDLMTQQDANVSFVLSFILGAVVIFMHRGNIKRLLAGTESKISNKREVKRIEK